MKSGWKYKLWKHLTKSLVCGSDEQKILFDNMWHARLLQQISGDEADDKGLMRPECIVAVQGTHYSGSSAVLGLLHEFQHVKVTGFLQPSWTKSNPNIAQSECCFFTLSGFPELLRIYRRGGTPEEADLSIKRFIQNTNQAYRCKRFRSGEFFPLLYGERFKEITQRFLIRIIEMNTYTQVYMKHREFPHAAWEDGDSTWDECSFAMGQGKGRYIHYQFARMTDDQFHEAVSEYLNDFFSIIRGGKILVFDQLLRRDDLELINSYMDIPIKQICVFRDPRDSYLSALRMDVHEQPATVSDFKTYHMNRRNEFSPDYPHRLIIRFEDLVLKYDETCQKIMEFLHLNVEEHIAKKSVFDPQLSVQNIGAYKHYLRPELMREIEKEMPECCYVPTKENLSRDSLMLLKTSGNWDDIL